MSDAMTRGTLAYVQGRYWTTMNQRTVNGRGPQLTKRNKVYFERGIRLEFSKLEFCKWVSDHWKEFEDIYKSGRTPSIDRINSLGHYSLDNLQVIDLKENMAKDRRKPVTAINNKTGEKREYRCAIDAESDGFSRKHISRACKKGINHNGWRWEFS